MIHETLFDGLKILERPIVSDERGFFSRMFCAQQLHAVGWTQPVVQINHSFTRTKGTVRGMHFQNPPHAEIKLVSCIQGCILDIAVDLRAGSPTFMKWHAQELSIKNKHALLIPAGFAHGFQALSENVEILYLHSKPYHALSEARINPLDPRISIKWPLSIEKMSNKDRLAPMLSDAYSGVELR